MPPTPPPPVSDSAGECRTPMRGHDPEQPPADGSLTTSRWRPPTLRLRIDDLAHPGVLIFFEAVPDPTALLRSAVAQSMEWLYTPESAPSVCVPSSPECPMKYHLLTVVHRTRPCFVLSCHNDLLKIYGYAASRTSSSFSPPSSVASLRPQAHARTRRCACRFHTS